MTHLLGLDVGSSACKAGVWTLTGELVAEARMPYRDRSPRGWWEAARVATQSVTDGARGASVVGVGLSGQIGTQVLLDQKLEPIGPVVAWDDGRSAATQAEIHARFGSERLRRSLGVHLPAGPAWPLGRLWWLKRERPKDFASARVVVQPKDYVLLRLCGELVSDASSWRGVVRPDGRLASDLLSEIGLPDELVPPIQPPTAVAGNLLPGPAEELGLSHGVPVVIGTNDLNSGLIGSGILGVGRCFDLGGTSEHAGVVLAASVDDPRLVSVPYGFGLALEGHLVYGVSSNGGRVAAWVDREFGQGRETQEPFAAISKALDRSAPGAGGAIFLPYLAGERSPIWDDTATGAWLRLRDVHTRDDLLRAALEGVVFNLRHILDCVGEHSSGRCQVLRVGGGVARSGEWNRIKADVLQVEVEPVDGADASALGAAMLAAVGVGAHSTIADSAAAMVRPSRRVMPNPALAAMYDESYAAYRQWSAALYPGGDK